MTDDIHPFYGLDGSQKQPTVEPNRLKQCWLQLCIGVILHCFRLLVKLHSVPSIYIPASTEIGELFWDIRS